jgi:SAM-dependent methyltransferase
VTAVEPAARLREVIQEAAGARDLTVVDGTAEAIPLADGSADVILSNFAVIFAPDPRGAIAELARVATPTGRILLTSWLPGVMDQIVGIVATAVREVTGGSEATDGPDRLARPQGPVGTVRAYGFEVSTTAKDLAVTDGLAGGLLGDPHRGPPAGRRHVPTAREGRHAWLRSVPACSRSSPRTGPHRPGRSAPRAVPAGDRHALSGRFSPAAS